MKIIAIGDFHGRFPEKLKKIIKKEQPDLILSTGDYANADKLRRIIFKSWTDKNWWEVVGLKKARQMERESFFSGVRILKELNFLKDNLFLIWGNTDFYKDIKNPDPEGLIPGYYNDYIKKMKSISLVEKKMKRMKNIEVVGFGGYLDATAFIMKNFTKDDEARKRRLLRYNLERRLLKKLFIKNKPTRGFIFLTHLTPYRILDKVKFKQGPMNGKHVGWKPYNEIIKKYSPSLLVCGHMHENQGICKFRNTTIVNPGSAAEGKLAIINFDEKNKKVLDAEFIK